MSAAEALLRRLEVEEEEEDVVHEAGGRYYVTLGDGRCAEPSDAEVASLARRMHRHHAPLAPADVYRYVVAGDFARDPVGAAWGRDARRRGNDDAVDEELLWTARLEHVAPQLVQAYEGRPEAATLGHAHETFSFATRAEALLARVLDRRGRTATARDVLGCLSRALESPVLHRGVTADEALPPLRAEAFLTREGCCVHGTRVWARACATAGTARAVQLACLVDERRYVAQVTLVGRHWRVVDDEAPQVEPRPLPQALAHALLSEVTLTFHRLALGCGGVVELRCSGGARLGDDDEWWWWVARRGLKAFDARVLGASREPVLLRSAPPDLPSPPAPVARERPVLERWSKSARLVGPRGPVLCSLVDGLATAYPRWAGEGLRAEARVGFAARTLAVFDEEFGKGYGAELALRTDLAIYSVHDPEEEDEDLVGGLAVLLFRCTLADGRASVALLLDSVAVVKRHQGQGGGERARRAAPPAEPRPRPRYGARIFRGLCLSLAARHVPAGVPFWVFAQCVRTGAAREMWLDRLDESSVARALLHQARALRPDLVPAQAEAACTGRAREYCRLVGGELW
jgi:hypothetical protein